MRTFLSFRTTCIATLLLLGGFFSAMRAQLQNLNMPGGNFQTLATVKLQGDSVNIAGLLGASDTPLIPLDEFATPNPFFSGFLFKEVISVAGFQNNDDVLVGTANGAVHRYDAMQEQWGTLRPDTGGGRTQVGVAAGSTIVAASEFFGIDRSTDGGQTFTSPQSPPSMSFIGDMVTKGDTVLVGGFPGVAISTDAGNTFSSTSFPFIAVNKLEIDLVTCTIYVGTFSDGLYRSVDNGATFQKVTAVMPLDGWVTGVKAIGGNAYVAIVDFPEDFSRIFSSTDDGQTFIELENQKVKDIVNDILLANDTTYFATTGLGLAISDNNGSLAPGLPEGTFHTTTKLGVFGDSALYAGTTTGGIFRADVSDPQNTWEKLKNSNLIDVTGSTQDEDGNPFFVGTGITGPQIRYVVGDSDSMLVRNNGITSPFIESIAYNSTTGTLLVGGEEMFRSSDKGQTYTSSNKPQGFVSDMIYVKGSNKFVAQSNFGLYESTDDGGTWQQYSAVIFASRMAASNTSDLFTFVAGDTIYRATGMGDIEALDDGFPTGRRPLDVDYSESDILTAIVVESLGASVGLYRYEPAMSRWQKDMDLDSSFEFALDYVYSTFSNPLTTTNTNFNLFVALPGKGVFGTPMLTAIDDENPANAPKVFALEQNYPNPFNPETTIRYQLNSPGDVQLIIYNLLGQKVAQLVNERQNSGEYQIRWNGRDAAGYPVSSGAYLYQLSVGNKLMTRKMLLVK